MNKNLEGIYKNYSTFENKKELDYNNNINKLSKVNVNLKKFINANQYNSSENLINQKINNNVFKFDRNKSNFRHSHNTSLNYIPSLLTINRAFI